jgi:pimeloyl-ACP methyl ester carboxylesterase
MTATVARKKAAAMIAEVEKGNDPAAAKDDERKATALKFDKAAALYLSMKESEVRGSSLKITRLYLTGPYFTKLHSMPVAKITKSHVSEALVALASKSGKSTARAARRHLAAFLVWCVSCGHSDINPCVGAVKFNASDSRDRVLSDDELRAVWNACGDDHYGRIVNPDAFPNDFAADAPKPVARFMAISQVPVSADALKAKATVAAWKQKPSYAVIPMQDRMINPDLERFMTKRAQSQVIELPGSHAIFLSHAKEVAALIEKAATAAK